MTPSEKWDEISTETAKWFHSPDMEGVLIALCAAGSHFYPQEKPVWLQILGASGSGKTELAIQACRSLPHSRIVGNLTPKAFLSSQKGPRNSLLPPNGGSTIWLAKDFGNIISIPSDEKKVIAAQLREIWDGELWRDTGQGPTLGWWGKVTVIAAATPELEESWGSLRSLGERFLTLRWRSPEDEEGRISAMEVSREQLGHVTEIRDKLDKLLQELIAPKLWADSSPPTRLQMRELDVMADLVALLRVQIVRDYDPQRSILSIGTPELPTRIASGLAQIVRTHQGIMHSPPLADSLHLARRVARDTIPLVRRRILSHVPLDGSGITYGGILALSKIPRTSLKRGLEELTALEVIDYTAQQSEDWSEKIADFTPSFRRRMNESGLTFEDTPL